MTDIATEEARDGELLRVSTSDGKYTVIIMGDGTSHALRWGEEWVAYPPGESLGNLTCALAFELERTRKDLADLREQAVQLETRVNSLEGFPNAPVSL